MFAGEDDRPKHVRAKIGYFGLGTSVLIPVMAVAVEGPRSVVMLR